MCLVHQSRLTLSDPLACSPPGSSVHGIFQARVLQWVAISFQGIFPTQGLTLRLLHWQAGSLLLYHLGSLPEIGRPHERQVQVISFNIELCVCVCLPFVIYCLPVETVDCMMYMVFHNVDFADYFPVVPFNMFPFPLFSRSCQVGTVRLMKFMSGLCPFHRSAVCGTPLSGFSVSRVAVLAAVDVLPAVFSHSVVSDSSRPCGL